MDFVSETRRSFIYKAPDFILEKIKNFSSSLPGFWLDKKDFVRLNGVTVQDGMLYFKKNSTDETQDNEKIFRTKQECEAWFDEYVNEVKMKGFVPNQRADKSLYNIQSKKIKITNDDWELLKTYMSDADEEFKQSDFAVFECYLANNFVDRDRERFSPSVLMSFNESIIGKSKLVAHQWGPPGNGRFFKSRIEKMTVAETLKRVGSHPNNYFKEHLELIEKIDGGIFWLVPSYYMLNVSDVEKDDVRAIKAGIVKDMSIGFRAPAKVEVMEKDLVYLLGQITPDESVPDKFMWSEFRNTQEISAEALEGSHVFLGSQYGAGTKGFENSDQFKEVFEKWFTEKLAGSLNENTKDAATNVAESAKEVAEPNNPETIVTDDVVKTLTGIMENWWQEKNPVKAPETVESAVDTETKSNDEPEAIIEDDSPEEVIKTDQIEDPEILHYVKMLDELIASDQTEKSKNFENTKVAWTRTYINTLEDMCFAFVERTGKKDESEMTIPKTARHLPHHPKGEGATGTGGTVDVPHLRNALARVGQVRPTSSDIPRADLIEIAKDHLIAHAKKLGVGEYGEANKRSMQMEFISTMLDVKVAVEPEKLEDGFKAIVENIETAVQKKLGEVGEQLKTEQAAKEDAETKAATLATELDSFKAQVEAVKAVFGEAWEWNPEDIKRAKTEGDAYRKYVVDETLKFMELSGTVANERIAEERKYLEGAAMDRLQIEYARYRKIWDERNPNTGSLPENLDEKRNLENLDVKQQDNRGDQIYRMF